MASVGAKNRQHQRDWYARNAEKKREIYRRWREANPEKDLARRNTDAGRIRTRARQAVYYALRTGRLKRDPCEVCGKIKVQAHHDDYDQLLAVRWLCVEHHGSAHRM